MLCGKLRYVTLTRPDIEFALNQCCKFQDHPTADHVEALLKIVGYLKKFPDIALQYKKTYLRNPTLKISGPADSSFADQPERRSSYGYAVAINGNYVSWKSRTTPMVATSVTQAEYVALAECIKEEMHIRYLLEDMEFDVELPMVVCTDSTGAIGVAKYQRVNNRTKHIDVRYHFAREQVFNGALRVEKVATEFNVADMFTKNLEKIALSRLLSRMSLRIIV